MGNRRFDRKTENDCKLKKNLNFYLQIGNIESKYLQDLQFVRCILPNNCKQYANYVEDFVLKQLNTSCVLSYARFIRFGFSLRFNFQELSIKCKVLEDKLKRRMDRSQFYSKVFLSIGFRLNEFKIGHDAIFFRSNKFELLQKLFCDMTSEPNLISATKSNSKHLLKKIEGFFLRSKWQSTILAIRFLGMKNLTFPSNHAFKLHNFDYYSKMEK